MRRWAGILLAGALAAGAAFSWPAAAGEPEKAGPPAELLRDNFERAELVLEVAVLSVSEAGTYPTDRGGAGYVVVRVHARPLRVFKGAGPVPPEFDYRFTREAGKGSVPSPRAGARLLVFLKRDVKDGSWWPIAEAAQFAMTPEVEREAAAWSQVEKSGGQP